VVQLLLTYESFYNNNEDLIKFASKEKPQFLQTEKFFEKVLAN